jgi:hypothetical protein
MPRFPAAFRPPAFASWASCPAREFSPTYDRPTGPPFLHGPDPGEVSMFRTHEIRLGPGSGKRGALLRPAPLRTGLEWFPFIRLKQALLAL